MDTLLDSKISECETFLEKWKEFREMNPYDYREYGKLSEIIYRAKVAYVLSFLEHMGEKADIGYIDSYEIDEDFGANGEFYYPDSCNFEVFMETGTPFLHLGEMENTRFALEEIKNNEMPDFDYESGLHASDDYDKRQYNGEVDYLLNALTIDLKDVIKKEPKINREVLYETAVFLRDWFDAPEYDLWHYYNLDDLYPYFLKRCIKVEKENGYEKHILTVENEDAKKIDALFTNAVPVLSQLDWYEPEAMQLKSPGRFFLFTFGSDCSTYVPYDMTQTNFVYGIEVALVHLYIFRLDNELHFLPKKFKGGEKRIFKNYKPAGMA